LKSASFYSHLGRQAPIEVVQTIGAETVHFAQGRGRGVEERLHVDALAARRERRQILLAARQHVHRAVVIALPQMMEGDANLQNALIQVANVAAFRTPQEFERFVLLEELAAVELCDAFEQERRRRFVAGHAVSLTWHAEARNARRRHEVAIGPIFYLHGFASSAQSTKAAYVAERLRTRGIALRCPDFNEPDFATLTMTRMLDQLGSELADGDPSPATLIGSSLGGSLAILAAARWPDRISRLVLLAPAVMIAKPGHHLLAAEKMDEWKRRGALPFFHYAYGEERLLNYSFHLDTLQHDPFEASFAQPTLIFQGLLDQSVDHATVEAFARSRPNVTLSLLDDDHQLIASLPAIWDGVARWLELTA
jgi:uncharacterized protein